jgi:hypothetical protein
MAALKAVVARLTADGVADVAGHVEYKLAEMDVDQAKMAYQHAQKKEMLLLGMK